MLGKLTFTFTVYILNLEKAELKTKISTNKTLLEQTKYVKVKWKIHEEENNSEIHFTKMKKALLIFMWFLVTEGTF